MFSDFILPSQDIGRYILPKGSTVEPTARYDFVCVRELPKPSGQ